MVRITQSRTIPESSYVLSRHSYSESQNSKRHDHENSLNSHLDGALAGTQDMQVESLPITNQSALVELGSSGTVFVRQSSLNPQYRLAFKPS